MIGRGDHRVFVKFQQIIQGLEAVGTITAATKLIEVKQRKVRKQYQPYHLLLYLQTMEGDKNKQAKQTKLRNSSFIVIPFSFPFLQTTERRNAQLKADLEEEEEQMKKLWEDITVRWINQNTKNQEK